MVYFSWPYNKNAYGKKFHKSYKIKKDTKTRLL